MDKKRIIVLGARGMLGRYVYDYLSKTGKYIVHGTTSRHHDHSTDLLFLDATFATNNIDLSSYDHVINCIGSIPQKNRRHNALQYRLLNVEFPHKLSLLSKHLIHISSDCVFDGGIGQYTETAVPNPNTLYGASKLMGEPSRNNTLVIRTSIIGDNSQHGLCGWLLGHKPYAIVEGFTNHMWNGVTCLQLAKKIAWVIDSGYSRYGTVHYHSRGDISKYQLLKKIRRVYEINITILKLGHPFDINRTLRSNFVIGPIPSIKSQLKEMRQWEFDYL